MILNKLSINTLVALLCVVLSAEGGVAASEMLFFQPAVTDANGVVIPQFDGLPTGTIEVALNLDIYLLEPGNRINLNLPDATYPVVFERVIAHKSGNKTWIGYLEDFPEYRVMLTGSALVYSGRIATPDKIYAIRHQQGKTVLVDYKAAGMTHVPLGEDAIVPPRPEVEGNMPEQLNVPATQMDAGNTNTIIDLMILYSPGVASDFPGPALQIEVDRLTAIANQAYADSGITTTLRVIKTQSTNYADFGGNSDAHNALSNNAGEFSGIGASRDLIGADLVILLRKYVNDSDSCGRAWRLGAADLSNPSYFANNYAYAVVSLGSVSTGPYSSVYCSDSSYPHEIGHLMGSRHDRNLDSSGGVFAYALGHYDAGLFGTIMSYEDPGVLYFSNPDLRACGNPMQACGIPVGQFDEADNRTAFNQTNPVLAGFRIAAANGSDDHGDSMATATPVAFTSMTNGLLEVGGDIDYFRVDVPRRGLLVVNTQGDTDTYGTLLDASGAIVAKNDDAIDLNFGLMETVEAGAYYITVEGYSENTTGDYLFYSRLDVSGMADDFNGDGKSDILTRHSTTGQLYLDEMDGNIRTGSNIGALSTVWAVEGIGDFGGDGKADIFIRHSNNGQLYLYEMDGNSRTGSSIGALSLAWAVAGVGDFGGDGKADILIRHTASGQLYLYEMDGNIRTGSNIAGLSLGWDVAGIGDFGGDGKADILLRNTTSGQLYLYEMDGNQKTGSNIGGLPLSWNVVGIGDLGGDGKDDIVIRNINTGQLYLYEMDGNARIGSNIGMLALSWEVARIADYGGDGKADILIRHKATGQLFLNEMDGNTKTGSNVGGLPTVWRVEVQ